MCFHCTCIIFGSGEDRASKFISIDEKSAETLLVRDAMFTQGETGGLAGGPGQILESCVLIRSKKLTRHRISKRFGTFLIDGDKF